MPDAAIHHPAIAAAAASDVGLRRENNEDRYVCDPGSGLFVVIDGVGGHAAGEHAAETALRMLRTRLGRETGSPAERVREAITLANNEVHRLGTTDPALEGMACVLTVGLVADGRLTAGHVGDTRLYTFVDGAGKKLTHDHSPVGEREDRGELAEREAMRHPRRNEIYRDVGSEAHNPNDEDFVEIFEVPFESDSAFLLCTDGLSDQVSSADIARIVYAHPDDPATIVGRLVQAANAAGGKDNVTVVFFAGARFAAASNRHRTADAVRPEAGLEKEATASGRHPAWSASLSMAYGLVAGLLAAALAFVFIEPVQQWLVEQTRPASWTRTWRVAPDGSGDSATIAEALRWAAPGDTVLVAPGEYQEALVLIRDVRLISQNPRQARLSPPPAAPQPWNAVHVQAGSGSSISGFTITGTGTGALAVGVLVAAAGVELDDVEITGAEVGAVVLQDGSRAVIRGSRLHDNAGPAIVVAPTALPRLLHNVIAANGRGPRGSRPGIEMAAGAAVELFGNIVAGNGHGEIAGAPPALLQAWQRDNIIGLPQAPAPTPRPGGLRKPAR